MTKCFLYVLLSVILTGFGTILFAQSFENVAEQFGINVVLPNGNLFGAGVSTHDFDRDGWDDISIALSGGPSRFYKNTQGSFVQVSSLITVNGSIKAIQWVDFDNDGDSDLFVTVRLGELKLLRNDGDWQFTDITSTSGFFQNQENTYGASWGDYDLDGDLDVYICTYDYQGNQGVYARWNHLYRNNGDETFTDVTLESGAHDGVSLTFQSIWIDYDRDGWPDLYLINDKISPNVLFRNLGDGTFQDVSQETNTNLLVDAMTATWGDYNNDSLIDFYETNTTPNGTLHMQNQGDGTFEDVAQTIGSYLTTFTWAAEWFDADNDMDLDMYVAEADPLNPNQPNHFFINNGADQNYTYTLASDSLLSEDNTDAHSAASCDFDNDGALDFIVHNKNPGPVHFWKNTGNNNHWSRIGLTGTNSNSDAIGSWIELYVGGYYQMRYTVCGENYIGQNSQYEHFGLGSNEEIDSLIISWPLGLIETFYNLPIDSLLIFTEGESLTIQIQMDSEIGCYNDSLLLVVDAEYDVLWNNGQTSNSIYGLVGQSYFAEITHPLGFTFYSDTISINAFSVADYLIETSPATCFDSNDGTIEVSVSNEVSLEEIVVNDAPDLNLDSLSGGTYNLTLIDEFGCQYQDTFNIGVPVIIYVEAQITEPLCFGDSTASILIEVLNAQGSWVAVWTDLESPENLAAGIYEVEVIDEIACSVVSQIEVFEPLPLELNLNISPFELGSSLASVDPEGGIPPYIIEWSNGSQNMQTELLNEGEFEVLVTDANGCMINQSFLVTGVSEFTEFKVSIYPIPATNVLFIKTDVALQSLMLFDVLGNLVNEQKIAAGSMQIDLEEFPDGMYFLRLQLTSGELLLSKIIIENPY
jgi:hypothetical protein